MVTSVFQTMTEKAQTAKIDSKNTTASREWYRSTAAKIQQINNNRIIDPKNVRSNLNIQNIGQMFMFFYDPKNKQSLPYYDRFPLVFPVELYSDGFLGINLHYLPHKYRANLMDALYSTINNKKNNQTTRLKINYEILRSASKMRYFKPCLKRYLSAHVLQKFLYIDPENWDKCLMLPTERFAKKSKSYVQTESARMVAGRL